MKAVTKFMFGGAAIAALVSAVPATAQFGGNGGSGVVGQIINQVLGYGQYPYGNYGYGQQRYSNSQTAVSQCASAAEARINGGGYGNNGYGNNGYGNNGYNNGYGNNGYGNNGYQGQRNSRVLGINSVEQKGYNRIKIVGVATSGRNTGNTYGYGSYAYNSNYGVPDLKFVCNADQSGRVYELRIKANDGVR